MKTSDFRTTLTSAVVKENINKMFGVNVNLEQYSREQLEDMRNKLRTRVFQQEGKVGSNDLLTNETYQKDKAMLDLLNTRIKEMLGENIKKLRDKMDELNEAKKAKPDFLDMDKDGDKKEPMKKAVKDKAVKEAAKPDFLDMDKDGNKKETMKKAIKDKKVGEGFDDMEKALKDKEKAKPNGGAGKKSGSAYGGSKQKQEKSKDDDKDLDEGHDRTWAQITDYEKRAKATKDNIKKQHYMKMAQELRNKLPTNDLDEGKDEGKPGKNFAKIAKSAGKEYGSKAAGERVAGAVRAKLAKQGKLQESNAAFKHNVKFVNESIGYLLQEDEEGKAKAITAAGDMVNDFTSWMQRVGQYQTKTMIELADAIKADFGAAEAEAFKQSVGPALSATLEVLTQQREAVSNAVAQLAGEAVPEEPMGMEPGMDAGLPPEPGMDMSEPDMMNSEPASDEFGASDAAAGMGTTGREMRESKFARRLAESHSIMSKLAK